MAAQNPNGGQKYWHKDVPFKGVAKTVPNNEGSQKYWFDGATSGYLYPAGSGGGTTARNYGFIIG